MKTPILVSFFILLHSFLYAQQSIVPQKKNYTTYRISNPPKIDGILDDDAWHTNMIATNFTQTIPHNGRKASQKTEVKICYDDDAIYVGAMLFDDNPSGIKHDLGERDSEDDDINSDLFIIELNPHNDNQLLYAFKLSASNVQIDEKVTYSNWDKTWDAIWYSNVTISENGWSAEIKIPFSSLRIPKAENQVWGMHLYRCIKRNEEWVSWNYVNQKEESTVHQAGLLSGISDINPPLRLSFMPYVSFSETHNGNTNNWDSEFKGGMDLKLGLSKSHTLDMILVPDFGQVQSDDEILNLSSVETYYDEKRAFFTEGSELFGKANVFYSRRIGTTPIKYSDVYSNLDENEIVSENPDETQIMNATKISGRNKKGLAIGFLNAITANTNASIKDTISGDSRKFKTQGLTNYNVMVIDKSLKNTNTISFINTNYYETDSDIVSDVFGTDFTFTNKSNSHAIFGKAAMSYVDEGEISLGYYYNLSFNKIKGNFRYALTHKIIDDEYNPNYLGYLDNNNKIVNSFVFEYNIYEPFGHILSMYNNITFSNNYLYNPTKFASFEIDAQSTILFKNNWKTSLYIGGTPVNKYDYNEPRVEGKKFMEPTAAYTGFNIQTDQRRALSISVAADYWGTFEQNKMASNLSLSPLFRINSKMKLELTSAVTFLKNGYTYVGNISDSDIYFGRYDAKYITNTLEFSYLFNEYISLSLRSRHYWAPINYKQFYLLNEDGTMNNDIPNDIAYDDINYNVFNIDFVFNWQFAPGSYLSLIWKNGISNYSNEIDQNYFGNLNNTWKSDQTNQLAIKLIYYLDWNRLF
ncbi:DUF5916 domain-containing protein [Mangrovimonas xylaniphaga]|uniref:DUF5916 domain-containing protein n=1 Tax=Mangrovimonas xylaniphaga TaxID=1645915 RepID=UPI0006B479C2|nr:DUF5916 domain-containing protein [Mangrovimonas xylaniphaga]